MQRLKHQHSAVSGHSKTGVNETGKVGNDEFPTMPVSLADLQQDDDDKTSRESGEVTPEAFDEHRANNEVSEKLWQHSENMLLSQCFGCAHSVLTYKALIIGTAAW